MTASTSTPERLPYTGDDEADRLLATDPLALLIGFALDQQVSVQKAFSGPAELKRRIGHLDASLIAATDPAELERVFRQRPALHRYPAAMATRVQALCAFVANEYDGRAERIWTDAADGRDLRARLLAVPSIGEMKASSLSTVLAKRFLLKLPGLDAMLPTHPTLGDVDSAAALANYQAAKKAYKAAMRSGGSLPG